MNFYLYISRVLRYAAATLHERLLRGRGRKGILVGVYQFVVYSVLYKASRKMRSTGHKKYLYQRSPGSAAWEIDEYMFRKLVLYVEGYLADIAHRITDAPKAVPPDRETRAKWGRRALEGLATERNTPHYMPEEETSARRQQSMKDWKEIGRIYDWYTEEYDDWEDPYIDQAEIELYPFSIDDESRELLEKSRIYEDVRHERRKGRAERLFERRHQLTYD